MKSNRWNQASYEIGKLARGEQPRDGQALTQICLHTAWYCSQFVTSELRLSCVCQIQPKFWFISRGTSITLFLAQHRKPNWRWCVCTVGKHLVRWVPSNRTYFKTFPNALASNSLTACVGKHSKKLHWRWIVVDKLDRLPVIWISRIGGRQCYVDCWWHIQVFRVIQIPEPSKSVEHFRCGIQILQDEAGKNLNNRSNWIFQYVR